MTLIYLISVDVKTSESTLSQKNISVISDSTLIVDIKIIANEFLKYLTNYSLNFDFLFCYDCYHSAYFLKLLP